MKISGWCSSPRYLRAGFGSFFHSEALTGALPLKQNSPQKPPYGLVTELISGSPFTVPRHSNRYAWQYRVRPSVSHSPKKYVPIANSTFTNQASADFTPEQYRFRPMDQKTGVDFVDGIAMVAVNGHAAANDGAAAGVYAFDASMGERRRVMRNQDGDMIVMPQEGTIRVRTEFGDLEVEQQEFALVPRGVVFQVDSVSGTPCKGYVLENFGSQFVIPDLGPIGISSGLAHPRHFLAPEARFEDTSQAHEMVCKLSGQLFAGEVQHSPFDVVAWYGNLVPVKYDVRNFMAINTVTYDHPDPSIGVVLSSYTPVPGAANIDFVVFPPRYVASENTFRPPWYHRNVMSEFMGLVRGGYDAKVGFVPGASSIHNQFTPHGPDGDSLDAGVACDTSRPERYQNTLAFMWESNKVWRPTQFALEHLMDADYVDCWDNVRSTFDASAVPGPEPYPFNPDGHQPALR
mmetsp:Transcript_28686/g.63231  ORF Transcript_28686/g.63231 Transcript_28686/m.63231 type:complete len:460 (+) Transcript_28686:47-1426(+)